MVYIKLGMGFIAAAAISWFVWYFHTLVDKAKDYAALQTTNAQLVSQHNQDSASAAKAAIDLIASEAARKQAQIDFDAWSRTQIALNNSLRGMIHASPVSTNPVCFPTAAERKLWNKTLSDAIH